MKNLLLIRVISIGAMMLAFSPPAMSATRTVDFGTLTYSELTFFSDDFSFTTSHPQNLNQTELGLGFGGQMFLSFVFDFEVTSVTFDTVTFDSITEGDAFIPRRETIFIQPGTGQVEAAFQPAENCDGIVACSPESFVRQSSTLIKSITYHFPDATAPIPEPQTYAMLLAGLGLVGWVGRRRKATSTV